jgi:flagellin-like hook-associated protein FlgL
MIITPKISNNPIAADTQNNSLPARRSSESQTSTSATEPSGLNALDIQPDVPGTVEPEALDLDSDVADAHAADRLMNSVRSGLLAQPGAAMLAQANLPPQSVYDLLQ